MIVNICGIPHEVKYVQDNFNIDTHFGQINYAKAEILINDDCPTSLKEESLCHEILHGLLIHIGREDLSADETFVQSLSNAIYGSFAVREVEDGKIH